MTAPKIDTQAPDMIHAAGERLLLEIDMLRDIAGTPDASSICDELRQWVRARIDDRLASAAREAAAAQAMREAAMIAAPISCYETRHVTLGDAVRDAIAVLPIPDPAALDRLIAERVREAVEAELDEVWKSGFNAGFGEALIAARGSKEGQS